MYARGGDARASGREISQQGLPSLSGLYIGDSQSYPSWRAYSFRFGRAPLSDESNDPSYTLCARFCLPDWDRPIQSCWTVPAEEWEAFTAFAEELQLERFPDGRSNQLSCSLDDPDGRQREKVLDPRTAELVRGYLTELALRLLDEQL